MNNTTNKKTALVLGGGGARGAYEIGVWQAMRLLDIDKNIDMVFGTSVGAINGAMVVQGEFEMSQKLWQELETDMVFDVEPGATHYPIGGAGNSGLRKLLEKYLDEKTLRKSPIEYGLTTATLPALTPHYLYKDDIPEGKLADFILASSAAFPRIKAQEIDGKKYVDGGFADVLPMHMALKKGATHIICICLDAIGVRKHNKFDNYGYTPDEVMTIQSRWDLGDILTFDVKNSKKLIELGYLEGLKAFGVLQGEYYSFPNGEFDKRTIRLADAAARVFELDPNRIYKENVLNEILREKILETEDILKHESPRKSFKEFKELSTIFKDVSERFSIISDGLIRPAVVIGIAKNIRSNPAADNFFFGKSALEKHPEEVRAARYLLKNDLV